MKDEMTLNELKEYYNEHELSAYKLNTREHKWFKSALKEKLNFIDDLPGEKKFGLYVHALMNDITCPPPCAHCGSPVGGVRKTNFNTYCSTDCKNAATPKKIKKTMEHRYGGMGAGSKTIKQKVKDTCMERYGTESYIQTQEFRIKSHETLLKKYGVDHISKSDDIKEKKRDNYIKGLDSESFEQYMWNSMTVEERWGTSNYHSTTEYKQRLKDSFLGKYGVSNPMKLDECKQKQRESMFTTYGMWYTQTDEYKKKMEGVNNSVEKFVRPWFDRGSQQEDLIQNKEELERLYTLHGTIYNMAEVVDINPTSLGRILRFHNIEINQHHRRSQLERDISMFISSIFDGEVHHNDRSCGFEIDLYIPSMDVAIEVNGLYWHSDVYKDKDYHKNKSEKMISLGLKHLHIWEDQWRDENKREIIKNKIRHLLGVTCERVYARNTSVGIGDTRLVQEFYDQTHLQGRKKANVHLCLKNNNQIIAALSLSKKKEGEWYIERYSSKGSVVGGFTKLLSFFKKNYEWSSITTHASKDHSNGHLYRTSGFVCIDSTQPNYFYSKGLKRISRYQAMKHKLPALLEKFDEALTEHQNMINHGFIRVYDSGSYKFKIENKKEKPLK